MGTVESASKKKTNKSETETAKTQIKITNSDSNSDISPEILTPTNSKRPPVHPNTKFTFPPNSPDFCPLPPLPDVPVNKSPIPSPDGKTMKQRLSAKFTTLGVDLRNNNLALGSTLHLRQSRMSMTHDEILNSALDTVIANDVYSVRSPSLSRQSSGSECIDPTIFYRDRNESYNLALGCFIKPVPIKPITIEERQPETSFFSFYELGKQIGQGAFACVYEGVRLSDGSKVAVKVVTKSRALNVSMLKREVNLTSSLHHPNVVACLGFYEDSQYFYIVNEMMLGGELLNRINQFKVYDEESAKIALISILKAVLYCHKQGIAHRDLKPENILLATENDDASIKITDFGLAKLMGGSHSITVCGTPEYIAPEVILQRPYDCQVDMWSLGVIAYILLSGALPFPDITNRPVLFHKITHGYYTLESKYWSGVSEQAKEFVQLLLQVDPLNRMTAELAISHPFLVSSQYYTVMTSQETYMTRVNTMRYSWNNKLKIANVQSLSLGSVIDLYNYVEMIGYGPYGYAYIGQHVTARKKVCVKVISKYGVSEPTKLITELQQLLSINHTGIIKVIQIQEMGDTINLVTNYQTGGNILDGITKKKTYSEYDVRMIIWNVLSPLSYIHGFKVAHRNLKPENILLSHPKNIYDIELSDFGTVTPDGSSFESGPPSNLEFMSPEILKQEELTTATDCWSVGVITYLLICGRSPFQCDSSLNMMTKILNNDYSIGDTPWDIVSQESKDFISSLLVVKPEDRKTCLESISHLFIQGTRNDVSLISTATNLAYYYDKRKTEINSYYEKYYN